MCFCEFFFFSFKKETKEKTEINRENQNYVWFKFKLDGILFEWFESQTKWFSNLKILVKKGCSTFFLKFPKRKICDPFGTEFQLIWEYMVLYCDQVLNLFCLWKRNRKRKLISKFIFKNFFFSKFFSRLVSFESSIFYIYLHMLIFEFDEIQFAKFLFFFFLSLWFSGDSTLSNFKVWDLKLKENEK